MPMNERMTVDANPPVRKLAFAGFIFEKKLESSLRSKFDIMRSAMVTSSIAIVVAGSMLFMGPAQAVTGSSLDLAFAPLIFDANPADPAIYDADLLGSSSVLTAGFNKTYANVATINGVVVDGKVSVMAVAGSTNNEAWSFDQYDNTANFSFHAQPSGSAESTVKFKLEFLDQATGLPVVIKNIRASVADIDAHELARFFSPSRYILAVPTSLTASVSAGNTTFGSSATGASATDPTRIAQVEYDSASSIIFTAGCKAGASSVVGAGGTCGFTINFSSALAGTTTSVIVAPTAIDDATTTPINTAVNGATAGNDTAVTGSTFSAFSAPANGTVAVNTDGTYTYTPTTGFTGVDSFIYQITTPTGTQAVATVAITVGGSSAAPNPAPVAVDDSYTTLFQASVNGAAGTSDLNTSGGTFTQTSQPSNGSISSFNADGTYIYTPATGFAGTDSFTYLVTMPDGQTAAAAEYITVLASGVALPAPVAVDDTYVTAFETVLNGACATADTNSTGGVYAATSQPSHGSIVFNPDGTFVYTPASGFSGTDSFAYLVTMPDGQTATATEFITIQAQVTHASASTNPASTTNENVDVNGQLAATGSNGTLNALGGMALVAFGFFVALVSRRRKV